MAQLVVDNFDEEQIWQELELQNDAVLKYFKNAIGEALSDQTITLLSDEEEEEEEVEEEGEEDEENASKPSSRLKKKNGLEAEDGSEGDSENDSDLDFDVDALEKRERQKKQNARTGSKTRTTPSEVDDKFFKLSEMESFLDEMDKQEGKEDEDDVDYFQDLPSDEDDNLDLDQMMSSKKKKKDVVWI